MARRAFFSFHYKPDASRAGQVRNMGMVEGNTPVSDNDWENRHEGEGPSYQEVDCRPDVRAVLYGRPSRQRHSGSQMDKP